MVVVPVIAMGLVGAVASAIWLAPHQGITKTKHADRVCPKSLSKVWAGWPLGPISVRSDAWQHLVPVQPLPVGPVYATVCSYDQQGKPVGAVQLDGARSAELAGVIDNPKIANPEVGTPGELKPKSVVVIMTYAEGDPAKLVINEEGSVSNGVLYDTGRKDVTAEVRWFLR
jgi:hypothetical protein